MELDKKALKSFMRKFSESVNDFNKSALSVSSDSFL